MVVAIGNSGRFARCFYCDNFTDPVDLFRVYCYYSVAYLLHYQRFLWIFRCGETACPAIRKPVVRKMETDLNAAAPPFRQMETTIPEQGTAEKYYSLNAGSMPYTSLIER